MRQVSSPDPAMRAERVGSWGGLIERAELDRAKAMSASACLA